MNIKEEIKILVQLYSQEVSNKLLKNDFELVEQVRQHTAIVLVDGEYYSIWMANDDSNTDYYDDASIDGDKTMTFLFSKYAPIPEVLRKQIRDNIKLKNEELTNKSGLIRSIEKTQMSNDLFFRFKGVYKDVKFTGYNDSDWWTKYKPTEIKEDDDITWQIDYDKMEAKYKPIKL